MHQPMAIDPESSGAVELLIDSGGVTEKGPNVTIRKVRVDAVTSNHFTYILDFFRCQISKPETYKLQVGTSFVVFCRCHLSQPFPGLNLIPWTLHVTKPSALSIRSSVELPAFVFLIDRVKID